jgi:hypothetical protein
MDILNILRIYKCIYICMCIYIYMYIIQVGDCLQSLLGFSQRYNGNKHDKAINNKDLTIRTGDNGAPG